MDMRAKPNVVPANRGGLLSRLAKDTRGNALMLVGAAVIPLTGMIGSGVDMARLYMVKSRLQQACDAGALAGRKYMTGTSLSTDAAGKATTFFNSNFPAGAYGTSNVTFTPTRTADGQLRGAASARVPMALMQVFGVQHMDLSVACQARFEVSNTDVLLVLDVTGSMAACPDNSDCDSGPNSKIAGLRSAVLDFYDTLAPTMGADARLRIGFVPYSSTVNMGIDPFTNSQLLGPGSLVDNWTYQSRVANMDLDGWTGTTTFGGWTTQKYSSKISNNRCTRYGNNESFGDYDPADTMDANTSNSNPNNVQAPATTYSETQATDVRRIYERVTAVYTGDKDCERRWRKATTTYVRNGRYAFSSWDYKPVTYNVANYKTGTPVQVYTDDDPPSGSVTASGKYDMAALVTTAPGTTVTGTSTTFEGCVEERHTVANATFTAPLPSDAYDLDVKSSPTGDDKTRWRPMWQELVYDRDGTAAENNSTEDRQYVGNYWCPAAASHLAVRSRSDVEDYVNDLFAVGNTYHDLGLAWGVRMITPYGMWAANNTTAPNGRPISRHVIFMTDGVINTPATTYSSHGLERLDRRVAGTGSIGTTDLNNRHTSRFLALCREAENNNNVTMWTIAFGTDEPPALQTCAPDRSYIAKNTTELRNAYREMAANIAKLRLSQ